jgi:hypothetical protein
MPVYDTEDAVALSGGDTAGLAAAANALAGFDRMSELEGLDNNGLVASALPLPGAKTTRSVGLRRFLGTPAWEVCASADGSRILAGMMGQGNTLITLTGDGKVLNAQPGGKFYPTQLTALQHGFAVRTLENDATLNYLSLFDADGRPMRRLAALGRCLQGTRDASATLLNPWQYGAFSITPDGRYAAVGGSKGVAV